MKILYLTGNIDERNGGPGTTTRLLCNELVKQGCDIDMITFDVDEEYFNDYKGKCNFNIYNYKTLFNGKIRGMYFTKHLFNNSLKLKEYDVVFINGTWQMLDIYYLIISIFTKTKVFLFPRGNLDLYLLNRNLKKKYFNKLFYRYLIKLSNPYFVALSNNEKNDILREFSLSEKHIIIAPNGIYPSSKIRTEKPYDSEKKTFLYLGRFHEKKNIENTILGFNIFNKNKQHILKLYGNKTPLYSFLKKKYSSETVKFMGYVVGDEKEKVFQDADCFILASYSEGIPMAVLEAISFGCKVVLSKECNIDNIEKYNLGIYTGHSPDSIAKALYELDFSKKKQLDKFLEYYSWENSANKIIKFIKKECNI